VDMLGKPLEQSFEVARQVVRSLNG
jgi:hypothetical protein